MSGPEASGSSFGWASRRRRIGFLVRGVPGLLSLARGGETFEDIVAFQGDLEGVGDPRHVMAAARPEEDVEGPLDPEMIDQAEHVLRADRPGLPGLFPSEQEGGTIPRREGRPVPA